MKCFRRITLILIILLIYFSFIFLFNNVKALDASAVTGTLENPLERTPEEKLKSIVNPMLTVLQILSIGIAAILIVNDGIKYVTASDSATKANLKRKLAYYIIGGVFVFAPVTITKYIINLADTASDLVN